MWYIEMGGMYNIKGQKIFGRKIYIEPNKISEIRKKFNNTDVYSNVPKITMNNINKVGKTRFILDKKYEFKKVEFVIRMLHNSNANGKSVWPFGIKHLFFLEADFRNDSYIVVDYTSEDFIDEVKDSIEVITSTGIRTSSLSEEGIRIFLSSNNGMLENEQEPSNDIKKPIARNLNTIYFHIPLTNEPIVGYKFSINKR